MTAHVAVIVRHQAAGTTPDEGVNQAAACPPQVTPQQASAPPSGHLSATSTCSRHPGYLESKLHAGTHHHPTPPLFSATRPIGTITRRVGRPRPSHHICHLHATITLHGTVIPSARHNHSACHSPFHLHATIIPARPCCTPPVGRRGRGLGPCMGSTLCRIPYIWVPAPAPSLPHRLFNSRA